MVTKLGGLLKSRDRKTSGSLETDVKLSGATSDVQREEGGVVRIDGYHLVTSSLR